MRGRGLLCGIAAFALFCGLTKGPQRITAAEPERTADSTDRFTLYTEAFKQHSIHNNNDRARHYADRALAIDSTYAPAWHLLSRIESDPSKAADYARRAYDVEPENKYYLETLGSSLVSAQRYEEAMRYYSRLTEKSTDPDHFRMLALLYDRNKQPFSAIAIIDSAENRFGRLEPLVRFRQRLFLQTQQFERAEEEAKRMIAEAPYLTESYLMLADVYAATRRDSLAKAVYREAIRRDTTDINPWLALGDYYSSRREYPAYLSVMVHLFDSDQISVENKIGQFKALTSNTRFYREYYPQINVLAGRLAIRYPDNREVGDLYADHLIASGNIEEAVNVYKRRTAQPSERVTKDDFRRIIEIENYLSRNDSVALYIDRAVEQYPDDADLRAMRGHTLALATRYDEAIEAYREALKYAQTDSLRGRLWGYIGDTEHNRGEQKRTYKAFERALRYYGDNSSVLNNYAYFLAVEGRDLERALTMATRATTLTPNSSTFLDTLAWVLYRLGRYEEAKRYMQQALSLDRHSSAELALHYGDILDALGEAFMAQTYWRKALERGYKDAAAIDLRIERQKARGKTPEKR